MTAWQKRARLAALIVASAVAVAVFATTQRREGPRARAPVPQIDPSAVVESQGATVRQVKGAHENFRLEAQKQLSYSDGSSKLIGVKITVERQGKTYTIIGDETRAESNQSHIQIVGHVRLTSSDGLDVLADAATYTESEGIVRAPGPVTFKRGSMKGSGVDFTYDKNRDEMGLGDRTSIQIEADEKGEGATTISSGSALLSRKDKFFNFERDVHIVRSDQIIDAATAVADITEDEKHITGLNLSSGARITVPDAAPGALSGLAGDVIKLSYAPNSEVLQRASITSNSVLRLAGDKATPEKTLKSNTLELALAPDGHTVTSLNAKDQILLDLPGPKGQPSKSIKSVSLAATGDEKAGLKDAVFTDNVEYRETGGANPPVQRVVTSRVLDTALANGFNDIRSARFSGNVRFRDGATQATAAVVQYQIASGDVELSGTIGNAVPRVEDDRVKIDAAAIKMTVPGPKLHAQNGVTTLLKPSKPGESKTKMPGLMQQDQQVNGKSDALEYDGNTSAIELKGNAVLWQGDTKIQAPTILVDGDSGNLSASGGVKSWILVQDTNNDKKVREQSVARGAGDTMTYADAQRKVTYQTNSTLVSPQGDIKGRDIVVYLGANGQDIERLTATGDVTFLEKDRRTVGEELQYNAHDEEYSMTGTRDKLVQMIRRDDEGCKESTGRVLTFKRGTDSLRIDGSDATRTQTKSVSCTALPRSN